MARDIFKIMDKKIKRATRKRKPKNNFIIGSSTFLIGAGMALGAMILVPGAMSYFNLETVNKTENKELTNSMEGSDNGPMIGRLHENGSMELVTVDELIEVIDDGLDYAIIATNKIENEKSLDVDASILLNHVSDELIQIHAFVKIGKEISEDLDKKAINELVKLNVVVGELPKTLNNFENGELKSLDLEKKTSTLREIRIELAELIAG